MTATIITHNQRAAAHRAQLATPRFDKSVIIQIVVAVAPSMALVTVGRLTIASWWLFGVVLLMLARYLFLNDRMRFTSILVGAIPGMMLLRNDFLYNAPVLLMGSALIFWAFTGQRDLRVLWKSLMVPGLVLCCMVYWGISYFVTHDYTTNLRFLEMAFAAALLFLLAGNLRLLAAAFIGIGISAFGVAASMMTHGDRLGMADIGGSRLGNPISLGIPLVLTFVLAIADRGRWLNFDRRILWRVVTALGAAGMLLLSTSRGSWLVLAVDVLVLFFAGTRQRKTVVAAMVIALFAGLIVMSTERGELINQWMDRTFSSERSLSNRSSGRSDQWMIFPRAMEDAFFLGFGPGSGGKVYALYSYMDTRVILHPGEKMAWHSLYMHIGIETGLLGLLILTGLLLPPAIRSWMHVRRHKEIVPLLGIVSFLVIAATVSGADAISGIVLGVGLLSYRKKGPILASSDIGVSSVSFEHLTKEIARKYVSSFLAIDKSMKGEPWGESHWLMDLPEKWNLSWFIHRDRVLLGYIVASRKGTALHVHRLAVVSTEQGRGWGARMVTIAARKGLSRGCTHVTLKVHRSNQQAIEFYRRLGFDVAGQSSENLEMNIEIRRLLHPQRRSHMVQHVG